jgi:hypothetical protein
MPNKHRLKKLTTKMLTSGNFKQQNDGIAHARRHIAERAELDKEEVNFDFENERGAGDFEKLEAHDDHTSNGGGKIKKDPHKNNKRKGSGGGGGGSSTNTSSLIEAKVKRQKMINEEEASSEFIPKKKSKKEREAEKQIVAAAVSVNQAKIVPTKSKKNKYFFMAHPEVLEKKRDEILSNEAITDKYVIDSEKMKLNEQKKFKQLKLKKKTKGSSDPVKEIKKKNDKKIKKNKLWIIEECESSDDDDDDSAQTTPNNNNSVGLVLDIDNIDKHFRLKKTMQRLADGTVCEVFKPEVLNENDNAEEEENETEPVYMDEDESGSEDDENVNEEEEGEVEEEKAVEVKKKAVAAEKPANGARNEMMEKLNASRFRFLNELLYTQASDKSFEYFRE